MWGLSVAKLHLILGGREKRPPVSRLGLTLRRAGTPGPGPGRAAAPPQASGRQEVPQGPSREGSGPGGSRGHGGGGRRRALPGRAHPSLAPESPASLGRLKPGESQEATARSRAGGRGSGCPAPGLLLAHLDQRSFRFCRSRPSACSWPSAPDRTCPQKLSVRAVRV